VDPDFAKTLQRTADALEAIGSGDPGPYAALWARTDDATLFGAWGTIEKGHEAVTRTFEWVGSRFSDGALKATYDVVHQSGDLGCTVGFERGVVRVDGGDPAPMTIRVTHLYRRIDGEWWLVHRHADFPPADQRRR
jgi:ketosteroid isomerase-like protein